MKKFFTSLMVLATLATAFSSCTKEKDVQKDERVSGKMKTITVKTSIDTRTTLDTNHENIIWTANDKISIFNDVDETNLLATYAAGEDLVIEVPEATEEIYAHYPYYSGNESGPESVSVYISNKQTQANPGELNGYNFPMVAKGTVSSDNKALISLYPVASALALNIYHTGLEGEESVKSVTVTPTANTNFIGSQSTDLTKDNITYTTAASSDPITLTLTNALVLSNTKPDDKQKFEGQIYVCLAKQSYSNVKFEIETTKGKYTITSSGTPFNCVDNDFVPVNINLNKAEFTAPTPYHNYEWNLVTNASQIVAGAEVIIASKGDDVAMSQEQKSNNRGQVGISKDGNKARWSESTTVQVFEVVSGAVANSVAFMCANGSETGKYIYAAASDNNYLRSSSTLDGNASWSVAVTESGSAASLIAQGNNTHNILRHNSGSALFSCYEAGKQGDIVLYIKGDAIKEAIAAPTNVAALVDGNDIIVTWTDVPSGVEKYVVTCTNQQSQEVVPGEEGALFEDLQDGTYTITVQAIAEDHDTYVDSEIVSVNDLRIGSITKGAKWSYTFENKVFSAYGTKTLNGKDWTVAGTANAGFNYDSTKGQQLGTSGNPCMTLTLSSDFGTGYGIESIVINTSGASSIAATMSISVGGVAYKCNNAESVSLTSTATSYTFESPNGLNDGTIVISYTQTSSKAIYVKSIIVNPDGAVDPVKLVMSDISCTNSGVSETSLSFSWAAVENATGYKVSVDGGNNWEDTQTATTYTWNNLSAGTTYTLYVKAIGNGTTYLDSDAKFKSGVTKAEQSSSNVYTLTPTKSTSNTAYANTYDVTINELTWNAPGNQNFDGYWRIGGKSIDEADRVIYGKSSISDNVNEIVISTNGVSNTSLTVNSITVTAHSSASDAASGSNAFAEFTTTDTFDFPKGVTKNVTFTYSGNDCKNKFYRIVFNLSNSANSNYGLDLTSIAFNNN